MNYSKVSFTNSQGQELKGHLELPLNQEPHNFILFAHCFTCNKNFFAARNISSTLAKHGFGVLRFDFTGLGESEGDFADTNFSGNVEDLLSAAAFLEKNHKAPTVLIGHSLGGAAAIFAAKSLDYVKAVVTIAAPSSPQHVKHLLKSDISEIRKRGKAVVNVGGRNFTIKEQFLEDLETQKLDEVLEELEKAILIMHSPQDLVVGIHNAEELYEAALHPKSFVSLNGADHLLMVEKDSVYAGEVIAAWVLQYIVLPEKRQITSEHQVVANLGDSGYTTQIKAGNHYFIADEPVTSGGNDFGPTPYEYLSAALAACTSMTIQMYARRKKWDLQNVETHVNYSKKHAEDCLKCEDNSAKIDHFERIIVLQGKLDESQKNKILEIAEKCPVHKTLKSDISVTTRLEKK